MIFDLTESSADIEQWIEDISAKTFLTFFYQIGKLEESAIEKF